MIESGNKIKILVDAHIFDHSYQGTATYIKGLYNSLVEFQDVEITLCAQNISLLRSHFLDHRFKFVQLSSHSKFKRLAIEYPKIIKAGCYDYAHFQYIVPLFKGTKFVNTIHDLLFLELPQYFPWTYRLIKSVLFKVSAIRSDLILSVSEYSKNSLINFFNINCEKILVTPNAVSIEEKIVDIKVKYKLNKYILFVSRFEPRKNHIGLVRAFLELDLYNKGYELVLIGGKKEPIEIESYNNVVDKIPASVKSFVRFYEGISSEELHCFYKNAACFVFPSFAEGFGIPPIEAGLNGCKVLCSNTTAMNDFNFFKYRFNPSNQLDFNEKLEAILQDEDYPYLSISDAIQEKYNWDSIARVFYNRLKNGTRKID